MRPYRTAFIPAVLLTLGGFLVTGCESTGGGGTSTVYYGTGWYGPVYYEDYDHDHDHDIDVKPPPRPDLPVRPEHPIASPPSFSGSRPTPMPSIPSTPRPSFRGGMGGGNRGGGRR